MGVFDKLNPEALMFEEMTVVPLAHVHPSELEHACVQSRYVLDAGAFGMKLINGARIPYLHKASIDDLAAAGIHAKRLGDTLYLEPVLPKPSLT